MGPAFLGQVPEWVRGRGSEGRFVGGEWVGWDQVGWLRIVCWT